MVHGCGDEWDDGRWPALDALIDDVTQTHREIARLQAAEARLLAGAVELIAERAVVYRERQGAFGSDLPLREISLELGAALRVSDRTVQGRIGTAALLVQDFAATLAAWECGEIDGGHVRAIVRAGSTLADAEARRRYETLALRAAETESATRLGSIARALAASVSPEGFEEALAVAGADRSVRLFDLDAGMARLIADLPAPLAYAIRDRLARLAEEAADAPERPEPCPGDDSEVCDAVVRTGGWKDSGRGAEACVRTADQVRADVFADLLLTGIPTAHGDPALTRTIAGRIQVTVPAMTLAGQAGGPALLACYGPVDPAFARSMAAAAPGWDRVFTDPRTGEVLATDRYRPTAELRRFLAARDERCRTPGCTRPAHRTDVDHNRAASEGGETRRDNLSHFCRRHHIGKHHTSWRVRQLGHGVLEWTGPSGRRYLDRPPAVVRFVPAPPEDPPPF